MDLGIAGRTALVAGASSGLGRGVAMALAAEGARVVMASRNEERIRAAAAEVAAATGGETHPVVLDVRDPDAGLRFVSAAREAFGPAAILVTNAGGPPPGPFERFDLGDVEEALNLNYLSAVRLTHASLPDMKAAGWGRIVHITSSVVYEPTPALFLSSTVRPAVAGFSKALALEVARDGITVNTVCPGIIATDRIDELAAHRARENGTTPEEEKGAMAGLIPVGRMGSPADLGAAVAFLCSAPAGYLTGLALRVDGGKVAAIL